MEPGVPIEWLVGNPFAVRDHPCLATLLDDAAVDADEVRRLWQMRAILVFVPFEVGPLQHLTVTAVRTGNVIAALVAFVEGLLDPANALHGRRRSENDLAIPERL